jgi:predicted membrane chloride channel (bestrophin family)
MPSLRVHRATDDFAQEFAARILRFGLVVLGVLVVFAGILISPIPGPGGIPVIVVGLMIVLRNSFKARRQFVRMQRAHPKMVNPLRRLLRRDPEIVAVLWQQYLRAERLVLPPRFRFAAKTRRRFARRRR